MKNRGMRKAADFAKPAASISCRGRMGDIGGVMLFQSTFRSEANQIIFACSLVEAFV
jgi:hypothetical protein